MVATVSAFARDLAVLGSLFGAAYFWLVAV